MICKATLSVPLPHPEAVATVAGSRHRRSEGGRRKSIAGEKERRRREGCRKSIAGEKESRHRRRDAGRRKTWQPVGLDRRISLFGELV
ncbi:hypothetical protein L2E82_49923 [Cichorium intybus]|uniref:Uncharacterized protein n=1 Tax=Cichorium intybus TaxID=13427 RepID=A0ACB8Z1Q2_CICIN|nr:hypothetical protein L2E82_49923 [Cichorium intybus]